jgi:hypothetical protein
MLEPSRSSELRQVVAVEARHRLRSTGLYVWPNLTLTAGHTLESEISKSCTRAARPSALKLAAALRDSTVAARVVRSGAGSGARPG